jgi:hypothetical protein
VARDDENPLPLDEGFHQRKWEKSDRETAETAEIRADVALHFLHTEDAHRTIVGADHMTR